MDEWYFIENDDTVGPVNLNSLIQHLQRAAAPSQVLVWKFGQPDWLRVAQIPDLMRAISRPPPRPVPPPRPAPPPQAVVAEPIIEKPKAPPTPLWEKAAGWVAAIVSMLLARYLGAVFWIPLLLVVGSYAFFKWLKLEPWTVGMLSVLCGHTLWVFVGHAIILTQSSNPEIPWASIDFVAVFALMFWSVKKQSVWSASLILCYQLVSIAAGLLGEGIVKITAAGMAMHLSLRALGIAFAIYAIVKSRQRAKVVLLPL